VSLCIWTDREIPTHFVQKDEQCVLYVIVMMRYYENMSGEFNVLGICSVGNDHKQLSKLCNCEFVFPVSRTGRKRVTIDLPTALLRNIAYSAYA
jgi:hypothetical protein